MIHDLLLAYAIALNFLLFFTIQSVRWHQDHPEASMRMAQDHEEQRRLEGRY